MDKESYICTILELLNIKKIQNKYFLWFESELKSYSLLKIIAFYNYICSNENKFVKEWNPSCIYKYNFINFSFFDNYIESFDIILDKIDKIKQEIKLKEVLDLNYGKNYTENIKNKFILSIYLFLIKKNNQEFKMSSYNNKGYRPII